MKIPLLLIVPLPIYVCLGQGVTGLCLSKVCDFPSTENKVFPQIQTLKEDFLVGDDFLYSLPFIHILFALMMQ